MRSNDVFLVSPTGVLPRHHLWILAFVLLGLVSASVFVRFEPHHAGMLALGWPSALPIQTSGLIGAIGCFSFYSITSTLWNDTRFSLIATILLSTSAGTFTLLNQPSQGLYVWVFMLFSMAFTLRWWAWRSGSHANPVSCWHPWDVMTGLVLGGLGASAGVIPLLWVMGTVALWFKSITRKRFSLREWWQDYKGITLVTAGTLTLGWGMLLARGSFNVWGTLVSWVPLPVSAEAWTTLIAGNLLLLGFPWYPILAYCIWNLVKHHGYHGKSGKLYGDESQGVFNMLVLWGAAFSIMLGVCFATRADTTLIQLGVACCVAWWAGYGITVASRFITPSVGLQLMLQGLPLLLLLLGIATSWTILTQLPDAYLEGVAWNFAGVPTLGESTHPLWALISLPFWKMGLLSLPLWCLVGSVYFTVTHAIRGLSLYRTVIAFGVWALGYALLMNHIQWPISHPVVLNSTHRLLQGIPLALCCDTLPPWQITPAGTFNPKRPEDVPPPLLMMTEQAYYNTHHAYLMQRYQALTLLLYPYWGLPSSPVMRASLLDVLPFYSAIPQSNKLIILRLKSGG